MCDVCGLDDDGESGPGFDADLISAARAIEARLPGQPASDVAWGIFAGVVTGSIRWADYQRLLEAYRAAEREASGGLLKLGRRRRGSLKCDGAQRIGAPGA